MSILLKGLLGTKSPLKIQASLKDPLWFFPMGCSRHKYHHFHGLAGRGEDWGGGGRGGTLMVSKTMTHLSDHLTTAKNTEQRCALRYIAETMSLILDEKDELGKF